MRMPLPLPSGDLFNLTDNVQRKPRRFIAMFQVLCFASERYRLLIGFVVQSSRLSGLITSWLAWSCQISCHCLLLSAFGGLVD
jgi:hypothetical protein